MINGIDSIGKEDIKMFKVKLSFDTDELEQDILEQLYNKVDEIFESEDLNSVDRTLVRVYEDKGRRRITDVFGRQFCTEANIRAC